MISSSISQLFVNHHDLLCTLDHLHFFKEDISIQTSEDLREQRQGEARHRISSSIFFIVNPSKTFILEIYEHENQFLTTEEPQKQHQGNCVPGFSRKFIVILRFCFLTFGSQYSSNWQFR